MDGGRCKLGSKVSNVSQVGGTALLIEGGLVITGELVV